MGPRFESHGASAPCPPQTPPCAPRNPQRHPGPSRLPRLASSQSTTCHRHRALARTLQHRHVRGFLHFNFTPNLGIPLAPVAPVVLFLSGVTLSGVPHLYAPSRPRPEGRAGIPAGQHQACPAMPAVVGPQVLKLHPPVPDALHTSQSGQMPPDCPPSP